jgi:hypothetical protein
MGVERIFQCLLRQQKYTNLNAECIAATKSKNFAKAREIKAQLEELNFKSDESLPIVRVDVLERARKLSADVQQHQDELMALLEIDTAELCQQSADRVYEIISSLDDGDEPDDVPAVYVNTLEVLELIERGLRSSGECVVVDAHFHRAGVGAMTVKAKLCEESHKDSLSAEFNRLQLLNTTHAGKFVGVLAFLDPEQVHLKAEDPQQSTRFWAMVMVRGVCDLRAAIKLPSNSVFDLYSYAHSVVSIVAAMHTAEFAWLDVKPANFILTSDSSGTRTNVVGIDLEYSVRLRSELQPAQGVTWIYAAPEFARKVAGESVRVYAEQFDLWSLGITIMEIFDNGQSFFSMLDENTEVQAAIRSLTADHITQSIESRFVGNQYRALRQFLRQTLQLTPEARTPAARLLSVIDGSALRGITSLGSKVDHIDETVTDVSRKVDELLMLTRNLQACGEEVHKALTSSMQLMSSKNSELNDALEYLHDHMQRITDQADTASTAQDLGFPLRSMKAAMADCIQQCVGVAAAMQKEALSDALQVILYGLCILSYCVLCSSRCTVFICRHVRC